MLALDFSTVVSKPSCSCDRLVLNCVCCILEKLLMSKSLMQKQERAATIAALATLANGSAAICVQAPDRWLVGCCNGGHLCAGTVCIGTVVACAWALCSHTRAVPTGACGRKRHLPLLGLRASPNHWRLQALPRQGAALVGVVPAGKTTYRGACPVGQRHLRALRP